VAGNERGQQARPARTHIVFRVSRPREVAPQALQERPLWRLLAGGLPSARHTVLTATVSSFPTRNPQSLRHLWAEVIHRAALDIIKGSASDSADAIAWMTKVDSAEQPSDRVSEFQFVCGVCELKPEKLIQAIVAKLSELPRTRTDPRRRALEQYLHTLTTRSAPTRSMSPPPG